MTAEQWQRVKDLFQAALEREPGERVSFLDQACKGDPLLRGEVEELLASDELAISFIEAPMFKIPPELLSMDTASSGADLCAGQRISHYQILSKLGAGGMGEVYLAQDVRLGRKVALKVLPPALIADRQSLTRFLREARLASALDHPNICTIHEVDEADRYYLIVMQYVEGDTLKQVISGRPLSLDSLLSISLQVAGALSAAHAQGIVHRDITSSNIMITIRGEAKVLDFGLAKLLAPVGSGGGAELTRSGMIVGTPSYMSPEQARGERLDHRSDIFSFGAVLYEMATGHAPFERASAAETMNAIINEPHPSISKINKDVPRGMLAVIDRALAKDPACRYQSVDEMMRDLKQVAQAVRLVGSKLVDQATVAYVAPHEEASVRRWSHWIQKRITIVPLALAAGLIMLGVIIWQWSTRTPPTMHQPARPINSMAVLPFKPLSTDNRNEVLELGMADALIFRLSGISGIVVRPISAVRKYADLNQDPLIAGREQRVDAVLEASIQMLGEKIRVTARLIKVEDGSVLWADKYDQQHADLFVLQDAIAEKLAQSLALQLTDKERRRLTKRYTVNSEAYQLYLKGRYFWNKGSSEGFSKAIQYFEQAITLDSAYAPAYAWLADAFAMSARFRLMPLKEVNAKAKEAALKALQLDSELAEAHVALGEVSLFYEWNWPAAEANFKRAIALEANEPRAHQAYAIGLACRGQFDDAMREIQVARELDPTNVEVNGSVPLILYFARRYDEAIAEARKALELDQNVPAAHRFLGKASVERRLYDEAIAAFRKGIASGGPALLKADLGHVYAISGRRGEALKILQELKNSAERTDAGSFDMAVLYIGLGETDPALEWLEKSYGKHERHLVSLKVSPVFDPLRSDSRFQNLLRRIGLWQ